MELGSKLTNVELKILEDEKAKKFFHSNFSFLNVHNGFRNGHLHMFMGSAGGGKSTLTRSMVIDVLCNRPPRKVLLWLSEETRLQFLTEFDCSNFREYLSESFFIYSEIDRGDVSSEQIMSDIQNIITENRIDILFYDNMTTSQTYMGKTVADQSSFVKRIKIAATTWDIPVVIIAHTGAQITENYNQIINMNDIRGSKDIVNQAEFFYILQTFYEGSKRTMTLRIIKHRGYVLDDLIYHLTFSREVKLISIAAPIPFEMFREAYRQRNQL